MKTTNNITLRAALKTPEQLTEQAAVKLYKLGLLKGDRTHTDLTKRLLAGDQEAFCTVRDLLFPPPYGRGPDWVNPPVWTRTPRVFGPDGDSGDLAAFSIGF